MRASLPLLALLGCGLLWSVGLWLGRPWPVTIAFLAPGMADHAFTPRKAQGARLSRDEGEIAPPRAFPALLQPSAGASQLTAALACAPSHLEVQVQNAFGRRRGLTQLAVGWPGRDDGYGVLEPQQGHTTFPTYGRGVAPPQLLTLTSLGGVFDGTGTLEVTPRCDD